jgi:hypothetical protein
MSALKKVRAVRTQPYTVNRTDQSSHAPGHDFSVHPVIAVIVNRKDHVSPRLSLLSPEFPHRGGRYLAIGGQKRNPGSSCHRHAALQRCPDAPVSLMGDEPVFAPRRQNLPSNFLSVITRTIIDKNDLSFGLVNAQPTHQLSEDRTNIVAFVKSKDDEAELP